MVFNLALQYTQNVEDAEEITQDVFVKISGNLKNFKEKSQLKTWIYRICINQCLDFIKSKNSNKKHFFSSIFKTNYEDLVYEPANFNHPGIILEQKEEMKRIFKAINQLPFQQKTALILQKIEGNSPSETAQIMNITEKAVENLIYRAKKQLQILLSESEEI